MSSVNPDDLQQLTQWDTPTICNGLELVCPERRATGFTTEPLVCFDAKLPPVIGYARTARIRAAAPSPGSEEEAKALRLNYYEYIASGLKPSIVVIEDLDSTPGFGAFWGEVNTHIHRGLGARGCVTNGSMRDLPDSATEFQLLAGRVGPSHAHVHLVDFAGDVTVHNMSVSNNDIIHMDVHGAVVIPAAAVSELPAAIDLISRREAKILEAARSEGFSFEQLKQAMQDAGEIH
ncbi:acyl transferase [Chromatiales bacterium (ex Bugula neritina AB1)]|nr:acyl transferase [Chromatiales bacterium (ex Bugula neritina AB1)]